MIEAITTLSKIIKGEVDPSRVPAIREMLDRAYGKAPVAIDMQVAVEKRLNEMSLEELMAVERKLVTAQAALPAALTVIEEQESLLDRMEWGSVGDE